MSSSDRLYEMLNQYWWSSQYPDIRQLTQLLSDITHEEKVRILKTWGTLSTAARDGHTEIITTILSSVPRHQRLDVLLLGDVYLPVHNAALFGKSDSVETILKHLTPEQQLQILILRDLLGHTPADWASRSQDHKKTKRLLIEYQQRAEQQMRTVRETDNNNQEYSVTSESQQTKLKLDNQEKDIQTLTSAVTELDTSNRNKGEILHKMAEESRELKSLVQDTKEEISKLTSEVAKYQMEIRQQREQILQQQTEFDNLHEKTTNLSEDLRAAGRQHQEDIANQKIHYETKLTEKQEQITHQQKQITQLREDMRATGAVRNLAICNLNDRNEVLDTTCTNLRDDVDRIDETVGSLTGVVERIDELFYPDTNAVGRGAPHDGGDEVVEEQWTVPQPATNA